MGGDDSARGRREELDDALLAVVERGECVLAIIQDAIHLLHLRLQSNRLRWMAAEPP